MGYIACDGKKKKKRNNGKNQFEIWEQKKGRINIQNLNG